MDLLLLKNRLKNHRVKNTVFEGYKPSAVLVPIVFKNNIPHLIYTHRSDKVRHHKNQISFPGGMAEKKDRNLKETALRESHEEVGIHPDHVEVLGKLQSLHTPFRHHITPYVGIVSEKCRYEIRTEETQEIIEVPLTHLQNPKNIKIDKNEFFGPKYDMPTYHFRQHRIWGATGRITREFLELLEDVEN